jgi:hypothetical protein
MLLSIAEAIHEEKIEGLVSPVDRRRMIALAPWQCYAAANAVGSFVS